MAFSFTPKAHDYDLTQWGSGDVYYLKGGKTIRKIGGLYYFNGGDREGSVDLGYTGTLRTWAPRSDKTCGTALN